MHLVVVLHAMTYDDFSLFGVLNRMVPTRYVSVCDPVTNNLAVVLDASSENPLIGFSIK